MAADPMPEMKPDGTILIRDPYVGEFGTDEPAGYRSRVICLCGPRKFTEEFRAAWISLVMAGHTVVGTPDLDTDPRSSSSDAVAAAHLRLIELADEVRVVTDESGYIGEGTAAEIAHACEHGKDVTFGGPVPVEDFVRLVGAEVVSAG